MAKIAPQIIARRLMVDAIKTASTTAQEWPTAHAIPTIRSMWIPKAALPSTTVKQPTAAATRTAFTIAQASRTAHVTQATL